MSDKAAGQKARSPQGCDENGPAAMSHSSGSVPVRAIDLRQIEP